nr:MAG: hypothetical protein [Sanya fiers-like virus 7]
MAVQTDLSLSDGSTAHVFTAQGSRVIGEQIVSVWKDLDHASGYTGLAPWLITERATFPVSPRAQVDTFGYSLALPFLAVTDGVPKITDIPRFEGKFFLPRMSQQSSLGYLANLAAALINSAYVKNAVFTRTAAS